MNLILNLLLLIAATIFCSCVTNRNGAADKQGADTLIIIHTNDHHGTIFSVSGEAGLSKRADFVSSIMQEHKNVLVLDAGDMNTGSVLSNMFDAEPDIKIYNQIGYDAVALGNHEFDNPPEVLEQQIATAKFQFISSNITTKNGEYLVNPYIINDYNGLKVLVVGATTAETVQSSVFGKEFLFKNELKSIREAIHTVKSGQKIDITILLTHTSDEISAMLADSIQGIDLIVEGHSHTRMSSPVIVNNTPIVSAFEHGKEVGVATIIYENGKISDFSWRKTPINDNTYYGVSSINIDYMLKPYLDALDHTMRDTIAVISEEFPFADEHGNPFSRMGESEIGNLVCDAVMYYMEKSEIECDFVLLNGGNVRAGLPVGAITAEDAHRVLPFENYVEIVELSGKEIMELFDFVAIIPQKSGAFAQVSSQIRVEIDAKNQKIVSLSLNNKEIIADKEYFVATNDYLSVGGDGYSVFADKPKQKTGKLLADAFTEYLKSFEKDIKPALEGRILIKNKENLWLKAKKRLQCSHVMMR